MEDFIQPLQQGVAKLSSGQIGPQRIQELQIYENVTFKRSGLVQDRWLVPEREREDLARGQVELAIDSKDVRANQFYGIVETLNSGRRPT
ncbi:hypothetical protein DAPPUDRAFT_254428 [Daphnia pulex]|uniref:Uncharacterized protein n=1 Tax=Daphnia pulex TaxID=6669 RepID=E9H6V3_DAPPU|nr:hypothetical protein DAPPUDRAFT_254428 [Daphnia pulex]|eukprot:EFX72465.1 hypothetical protein DAPPUDRAFT_254428 [Daphnia pulex]